MDKSDCPQLLCTGPLPAELLSEARAKGVQMDCLSFIQTEEIHSERDRILNLAAHEVIVLFTSINAVQAVRKMLGSTQPAWRIFSIGGKTSERVRRLFPESELIDEAPYGVELAEKLAAKFPGSSVTFFCGDISRKETQDVLKANGIALQTIVVYKTVATPHKTRIPYNGVLFFSPSAVESYFKNNPPLEDQYFFAIGTTTAEAIKKFNNNNIITGPVPDKRLLVETAIRFFTEKSSYRDHEYTTK